MGWSFDDDGPVDPRALLEAQNGVRQARVLAGLIVDALAMPERCSGSRPQRFAS